MSAGEGGRVSEGAVAGGGAGTSGMAGGGASPGGLAGGGASPGGGARWVDRRAYAYAVTAGFVLLMLAPLFRRPPVDSFPLSTYLMFSRGRRDASTTVERAVGVDARGGRRPIPSRLVGSEEVLQAKATLAHSIRQGASAARALCRGIAARVAEQAGHADMAALLHRGCLRPIARAASSCTTGSCAAGSNSSSDVSTAAPQ
ncbi:hypothetical protein [Sorangium sp. So ce1335]|uniref:hypothetical protein n=1 Tax=Sorangium sp. So ce1335 TaxID=3133335 RepID=UPI003F625316